MRVIWRVRDLYLKYEITPLFASKSIFMLEIFSISILGFWQLKLQIFRNFDFDSNIFLVLRKFIHSFFTKIIEWSEAKIVLPTHVRDGIQIAKTWNRKFQFQTIPVPKKFWGSIPSYLCSQCFSNPLIFSDRVSSCGAEQPCVRSCPATVSSVRLPWQLHLLQRPPGKTNLRLPLHHSDPLPQLDSFQLHSGKTILYFLEKWTFWQNAR